MEDKTYRTFYGTESSNVCAYCWKHYKSLTPKQVKQRECLKRQCSALKKNEAHPYWKSREDKKAKRRARKERLDALYEEVTK